MSRPAASRGHPQIVVFGRRPVLEALACDDVEVMEVRVAKDRPADLRKRLRAACRAHDLELHEVDTKGVAALSEEPRHDQGVAASVRLLTVSTVESLVASARGRGARNRQRVLALDSVTNSQNVGMIARSVVASGMDGLLWPRKGCPWIDGLVVKASAATIFRCPIYSCETLVDGLWALQGAGFVVYGLEADAPSELFSLAPAQRSVYVVGSEAQGLSDVVRQTLDESVSIEMAGGVESLNVAVAAALVCFSTKSAMPKGA